MLKYKCLVLDHDDTVVKSTSEVHYPVFKNTLAELRPDIKITVEDFILYCFDPGFNSLCFDILKFTQEEMDYQVKTWNEYVSTHIPSFYPGMKEILKRQKDEGGLICVVSHSYSHNILRDYKENCSIVPDMIFGWELGENQRKPHPYPLETIMRKYNLKPEDLIMIDDLKPGFDMAKACNVDFACAGWSYSIDEISNFMKTNCNYYFDDIKALNDFLFHSKNIDD